ncbi:MAG: PhoH family protein [Phycisphaerae bacterium]
MDLTITLQPHAHRTALFGPNDKNLRILREMFDVQVVARDSSVKLCGRAEAVGKTASVIERMQQMLLDSDQLDVADVHEALASLEPAIEEEKSQGKGEIVTETIEVFTRGVKIIPKTPGQAEYIRSIANNDLVFCLGPAGTGKTYLAVAMAVSSLKQGVIKRIVLVRPAVEAGEKLGYLPGDLQAKVNPYLRPLFDAMQEMMGFDQLKRFMMNDLIEVIPLAYMRGRTLNNAAIIMDEAQNTTASQMLMFLTRLGHHSKMVVTGDDTQVDLERPDQSGLVDAVRKLGGVKGIGVVRLTGVDIVRHRLVQTIVEAYGGNGKRK